MKYYIIAGEASGDLHGSNLIRGLKKSDPEAQFRLWGGDLMQQEGGKLVQNYRDLAFMGYVEVLKNIRTIKQNLDFCKQDIINYAPDILILIDYPGFNLKIAQFGKEHNIRVFYYISPKVWAWKEGRVKKIKRYVDRMFSILPFEVEYYNTFHIEVEYRGNPVLDAVTRAEEGMGNRESFLAKNQLPDKPIIGLIPGSRIQEIKYNLPVMLQTIRSFPGYQFIITCSHLIEEDYYSKFTAGYDVHLTFGQTYSVMKYAEAVVVTSGTATLEAALLKVPQVVCYRANLVSMLIVYFLVKVKHISLVNLIMEEEVVKELLQYKLTHASLKSELYKLLNDRQYRNKMLENYSRLADRIGPPGVSERVAERMVDLLTG